MKKSSVSLWLLGCLLAVLILPLLPGCRKAPYPPGKQQVQAAAEAAGLTLTPEGPQHRDRVMYTIQLGDRRLGSVACSLEEGQHFLDAFLSTHSQQEKPEFSWADWENPITLAENLYGLAPGSLYQALNQQEMSEPSQDLPWQKNALWEAELPGAYARFSWTLSGSSEPSNAPETPNWTVIVALTLYPSRTVYEAAIQQNP